MLVSFHYPRALSTSLDNPRNRLSLSAVVLTAAGVFVLSATPCGVIDTSALTTVTLYALKMMLSL